MEIGHFPFYGQDYSIVIDKLRIRNDLIRDKWHQEHEKTHQILYQLRNCDISIAMFWGYHNLTKQITKCFIDGLVQDCSNCIADALELQQSCTKPSIYVGSELGHHSAKDIVALHD